MLQFRKISDTHVQVYSDTVTHNFTRLPYETITFARHAKYLEIGRLALLGLTPAMVDELFKPMLDFAKSGKNDITADEVAEAKRSMFSLYENIKERTRLAQKAILHPLEVSGVFWVLDNENADTYDATLFHAQKLPLMTCCNDAKVFFLTAGVISLNNMTNTYATDLDKLNTVREYCELLTIMENITATTKLTD